MGYYLPLRETDTPVRSRWSRWLMRFGGVSLLVVVALTEFGLLAGDTSFWWVPIGSIAAGLYMFWEVG